MPDEVKIVAAVDTVDDGTPEESEFNKPTDEGGDADETPAVSDHRSGSGRRRVIVYVVIPLLCLLAAVGVGFLKWQYESPGQRWDAAVDAVRVAGESTTRLLSYEPATVERDLEDKLTLVVGDFKQEYASLMRDIVIPGSTQDGISSVAQIAGTASVSGSADRVEVLIFVNQTVTIGTDAPTNTASSLRVVMVNEDGRWLIAQFEPI